MDGAITRLHRVCECRALTKPAQMKGNVHFLACGRRFLHRLAKGGHRGLLVTDQAEVLGLREVRFPDLRASQVVFRVCRPGRWVSRRSSWPRGRRNQVRRSNKPAGSACGWPGRLEGERRAARAPLIAACSRVISSALAASILARRASSIVQPSSVQQLLYKGAMSATQGRRVRADAGVVPYPGKKGGEKG